MAGTGADGRRVQGVGNREAGCPHTVRVVDNEGMGGGAGRGQRVEEERGWVGRASALSVSAGAAFAPLPCPCSPYCPRVMREVLATPCGGTRRWP